MSISESYRQIWQETTGEGGPWNLERLLQERKHPRTHYPGRSEIIRASGWENDSISRYDSDNKPMIRLTGESGKEYHLPAHLHRTEIVAQTFDKLLSSLREEASDPVIAYIRSEYEEFRKSPSTYGTEILLFDPLGDESGSPSPRALLQLPSLPVWKLAITLSNGNIVNDRKASLDWYRTRLQAFSRQHIAVAGASVASQAAISTVRLIKPFLLSIADPKGPNASNLNRTCYTLTDLLHAPDKREEVSKAVALARHIHDQDPFQLIYLYSEGIDADNMDEFLSGGTSAFSDDRGSYRSLLIEAIDQFPVKYKLLEKVRKDDIPAIQLVDILSRSVNGFNSPGDLKKRKSLFYGLSDKEIAEAFNNPSSELFAITATLATGAENAFADPSGKKILKGMFDGNPFKAIPQTGEVAAASGVMAARNAAQLILAQLRDPSARFPDRQHILDIRTGKYIRHRRMSIRNKILSMIIKAGVRTRKVTKI